MKIEAVIFDLDGTLIDTIEDIAAANNKMLGNNNFPQHDVKKYIDLVGEGAGKLVKGSLPTEMSFDEEQLRDFTNEYACYYLLNLDVKSKIYSGINTNKPHDQTLKIYASYFQKWKFNLVIGHQVGNSHKPYPDGALAISSELHIKPENILFVGDSAIDVYTAKAAGMIPVAVTWGYGNRDELMNSGFYKLIQTPVELLSFFQTFFEFI
jgi:phosphoglycolate phosphatase